MLENAHHEHPRIILEDILGSVSMVDVEINDRDALEPCTSRACLAAIATLLKKQNPIALEASAWWPGGLTAQKAFSISFFRTRSVARIPAPAERSAACMV